MLVAVAAAVFCLVTGTRTAKAVSGQIWENQGATSTSPANDALISNKPATPPNATFTVGPAGIDYDSRVTAYTIGPWIDGAPLSNPIGGDTMDNTYFYFTGQTFLNAGANMFVTPHDDGFELAVSGAFQDAAMMMPFDLQQPGPTSPVNTPYTVYAPTARLYDFTLAYGECCGPPAVLGFMVNGAPVGRGTPLPAASLGGAVLMVGIAAWRKLRSRAATAE